MFTSAPFSQLRFRGKSLQPGFVSNGASLNSRQLQDKFARQVRHSPGSSFVNEETVDMLKSHRQANSCSLGMFGESKQRQTDGSKRKYPSFNCSWRLWQTLSKYKILLFSSSPIFSSSPSLSSLPSRTLYYLLFFYIPLASLPPPQFFFYLFVKSSSSLTSFYFSFNLFVLLLRETNLSGPTAGNMASLLFSEVDLMNNYSGSPCEYAYFPRLRPHNAL